MQYKAVMVCRLFLPNLIAFVNQLCTGKCVSGGYYIYPVNFFMQKRLHVATVPCIERRFRKGVFILC